MKQVEHFIEWLHCKDVTRAIWQNLVEVFQQRALEKLHQTCSAPCIYQTILELSEYSGIYTNNLQKS